MRPFIAAFLLITIGFYCPAAMASTGAERTEELFLEGKYDKALAEADKAISADSGKRYELYYIKGLSAMKLNKFAEARRAFEYVKERYPRCDRALDSYIGIGDAYYLEGNTTGALRSYKAAADAFADDKNIVVVRQRIAECLAKPGMQEKLKEYTEDKSFEAKPVIVRPVAVKSVEKPKKSVNFVPKKKTGKAIESQMTVAMEAASPRGAGQFSVQVGSFKKKSNASKLASKLSARRYDARVESLDEPDKLYRVKVGRISSKEEAERLAIKLKREGYPTRVCQED